MGAAVFADVGMDWAATGSSNGKPIGTKRQQCEYQRAQLEAERSTFISHWQLLNNYIFPRRGRFSITDVNRGDRRNLSIVDSTATTALQTLQAGMMTGITPSASEWFRLTVPDPDLAEQDDVKLWLHAVQERMEMVFLRSNLYNKLPILYGDMGCFATGAMMVAEDPDTVIRCFDFPVGSYAVGNDKNNVIRTFVRTFRFTVRQIIQRWGNPDPVTGEPDFMRGKPSKISFTVQNLWRRQTYLAWIDLAVLIQPNVAYDGDRVDSAGKRFSCCYYELGTPNQQTGVGYDDGTLLEESGFDEFPVLVGRWETNSEDAYGTSCPGMTALGDIRELQTRVKRSAQAVEKMINPPMTAPSSMRTAKASTLPGDVSYVDVTAQGNGFQPAYQINFAAGIQPLEAGTQMVRARIDRVFFKDLFLLIADTADQRDRTATEIEELKQEKLVVLGPMLSQLNVDVLDPLVSRTFNIMVRQGRIPPAPEALQGVQLRVEYVSIMAQAQRSVRLAGLERFAGFIGQAAQYAPAVLDNVNDDELVTIYADSTGVPPKVLRPKEEVAQMRQARAQQEAQQQAAQNIPGLAGAAKDLSETQVGGNSALAALVGKMAARRTVDAAPVGG